MIRWRLNSLIGAAPLIASLAFGCSHKCPEQMLITNGQVKEAVEKAGDGTEAEYLDALKKCQQLVNGGYEGCLDWSGVPFDSKEFNTTMCKELKRIAGKF